MLSYCMALVEGDQGLFKSRRRRVVIVDQLTSRGIVGASALYEAPFSSLHAGGPDVLFAKKPHVLEELFRTLESLASLPPCATG